MAVLLEENLQTIQHIGIPVYDIEKSQRWYIQKLDFNLVYKTSLPTADGEIKFAFLERQGLMIEFYQLTGQEREAIRGRSHGHIDHFAIDVLDIRKGIRELQAGNVHLDPDTPDGPVALPTVWSKGVEYAFFTGPEGERFELNERKDLSSTRRERNLGGWAHLGIPVTDIEKSKDFYQKFGFIDLMDAEVTAGDQAVKISILEKGGLSLEFYQLLAADLPGIRNRQDGHIDHVAMNVKDIERAFTELKAADNIPLEPEPVYLPIWEKGEKYLSFRGPDNEKIELNQKL
jgi:catechol 2,3-dioxygenase-like lactoylglutathione lyase family enzyme